MTREIVRSVPATTDLLELWSYVAEQSPSNADKLLDRLFTEFEVLASNPHLGRARDELRPGLRSFPVGRYVIYYVAGADSVEIVRVISAYRDVDAIF